MLLNGAHLLIHAVQKHVNMSAVWAQPRRIVCGHCHESFIYLATAKASAQVAGWRWQADEALNAKCRAQLGRVVEKRSRKARLGAALCPGCHRYQDWMIRASRLRPVTFPAIFGFLAGVTAGALVMADATTQAGIMHWEYFGDCTLAGLLIGSAIGFLIGMIFGLKPGAHLDGEDPNSLTENGWKELASRAEPLRTWFFRTRKPLKKNVIFWPVLLKDETNEPT